MSGAPRSIRQTLQEQDFGVCFDGIAAIIGAVALVKKPAQGGPNVKKKWMASASPNRHECF